MDYLLRDGGENDYAWITDTWVKCNAGSKMALDAGDLYTLEQKRLILRILLSKQTRLIVAHVPDDPDALLGYAVGKPGDEPAVYYVYVRSSARRQKMACAMLAHLLHISPEELACRKVQYSHRPMVPSVKAPAVWRFNPYRNLDSDALLVAKS